MFTLMITGGLGSGKSTAAQYCSSRGAAVIDLDDVAAGLLVPGSPVLTRVVEVFGSEVLDETGSLDRAALAHRAFSDPESVARLNAIVHPAVADELERMLDSLRSMPRAPVAVVIEAPLLAEAPAFAEVADRVLAISASDETRLDRASKRGMNVAEAERRMRLQASDSAREALADDVIFNDGSEEQFIRRMGEYWDCHLGGEAE